MNSAREDLWFHPQALANYVRPPVRPDDAEPNVAQPAAWHGRNGWGGGGFHGGVQVQLIGGLEYLLPFSWEWNNHPN